MLLLNKQNVKRIRNALQANNAMPRNAGVSRYCRAHGRANNSTVFELDDSIEDAQWSVTVSRPIKLEAINQKRDNTEFQLFTARFKGLHRTLSA